MHKIGIIDFNIFTLDGTTRSDINVIREFADAGYQVDYFNYRPFTNKQIEDLRKSSAAMQNVSFLRVKELPENLDCDAYFITREKLLSLAPYIRAHSNAMVIGELHGPVDMIKDDLFKPYLPYLSCLRVATPSIKERIRSLYGFDRVYVQNVSVRHLINAEDHFADSSVVGGHINLVVRARFAYPKDVGATVKLFSYLVNELKHSEFRLYLTGYGPEEKDLKATIANDGLEGLVQFTDEVPENHIYVSTSQLETLGYSICEEFAEGHPVIAYAGDDGVIKENFGQFKNCLWIDKVPAQDAQRVVDFAYTENRRADYRENRELIAAWNRDYVKRFEHNVAAFSKNNNEPQIEWAFSKSMKILRHQFDGGIKGIIRPVFYTLRNLL